MKRLFPTQKSIVRYGAIITILLVIVLVLSLRFAPYSTQNPSLPKKQKPLATKNSSQLQVQRPSTPSGSQRITSPAQVKAIYMSSWVASLPDWRTRLMNLVIESDANAIVIDIKDSTGHITFDTQDPILQSMNVQDVRIKDLPEFIRQLHHNGIYVIARIAVFQDPVYAKKYPSDAIQTLDGAIWSDRNGLHFVDPSSQKFWDYIVRISYAAANAGFDELNFDYVRFPTDGNMANITFPLSGHRFSKQIPPAPTTTPNVSAPRKMTPKETVMKEFFQYLHHHTRPLGIPTSVDLFGMTMTANDDVNIGQHIESAAPYFDFVCPMVYPSHYPANFIGYANPAAYPYEIIKHVMTIGASRMNAIGQDPKKLRPWLQDFNLGATYDVYKVRAQIKATYDSGLVGWMMWDPRNKYTRAAYFSTQTTEAIASKNRL